MLVAGCGRFGFSDGADASGDSGPSGDDAASPGDDADPDAMRGADGTGGLPAGCVIHTPFICDNFERTPLTDYQGPWDGVNTAAGDLSLTNMHFYGGTTALQVHLDSGGSARAVLYKDIVPPTQNVRYRYALRFDAIPDRTVFMADVYLQNTTTMEDIHLFPNFTSGTFQIEAELIGNAGVIREAYSAPIPLPIGRWFELEFDLDLSSGTPVLTVSVDDVDVPSMGGPYVLDPFTPTNLSLNIGTGFSEGGSPIDYWVDDVSAFTF